MTFQPLVLAVLGSVKLKSSSSLRFQNVSSDPSTEKKRFVEDRFKRSLTGMDGKRLSRRTSTGKSVNDADGMTRRLARLLVRSN